MRKFCENKCLIFHYIFLSFCLFIHNTYVKSFSRNFRMIFIAKFSHYFLTKCSHYFTYQIKAKFREKSENFCIFRERTKCENKVKWSRRKKFRKMRNFRKTIFPFAGNPSQDGEEIGKVLLFKIKKTLGFS